LGRCAYCDRKSFKGWLRCKAHTMYNRLMCALWGEKNKEHVAKYVIERRNHWLSLGKCICSAHRPLAVGRRRCRTCITRHSKSLDKDFRI
jgi:hypothetical protein